MKKINKKIILLFLVVIGLFSTFFAGKKSMKNEMEPEITSTLIFNKLINVRELTSLKYYYTNMGQFENQNTFLWLHSSLYIKKFIVSYDGVIHAGVDLEKMEVKLKDKSIEIKIPASKILSHEIYEDSLKVFDERESIFNKIDIEDYNNFSKDQKKEVEDKAIKRGLLKEADEEAKKAIEETLIGDTILSKYEIKIIKDENLK
ncbi:DUF4230 domain-containing protein [Peptoniphilus timonensis]|uniref:DUF4230 domain-containing protein n=1 Tax=Peptoniphilus timonensis TaxID=1268254 RepID=UPI00031DB279|nr:DUF4230 domain-containing protein [Peptoniphilus timonensis]